MSIIIAHTASTVFVRLFKVHSLLSPTIRPATESNSPAPAHIVHDITRASGFVLRTLSIRHRTSPAEICPVFSLGVESLRLNYLTTDSSMRLCGLDSSPAPSEPFTSPGFSRWCPWHHRIGGGCSATPNLNNKIQFLFQIVATGFVTGIRKALIPNI